MTENNITFGCRLKQLREESNLTLDELKDILLTTKATLSRYENELREPKFEFVERCANYFNISVDYILGRTNERIISECTDISIILKDTLDKINDIEHLTVDGETLSDDAKLLIEGLLKSAVKLTKLKE